VLLRARGLSAARSSQTGGIIVRFRLPYDRAAFRSPMRSSPRPLAAHQTEATKGIRQKSGSLIRRKKFIESTGAAAPIDLSR